MLNNMYQYTPDKERLKRMQDLKRNMWPTMHLTYHIFHDIHYCGQWVADPEYTKDFLAQHWPITQCLYKYERQPPDLLNMQLVMWWWTWPVYLTWLIAICNVNTWRCHCLFQSDQQVGWLFNADNQHSCSQINPDEFKWISAYIEMVLKITIYHCNQNLQIWKTS